MRKNIKIFSMVLVAVVVFGTYGIATAESAADFYKKQTVTFIITYGPGGGTDVGGRIIAKHWKKLTGGKMVIRNLTGAGGIRAMNYIYRAKPDGKMLGYTDSASSLLGPVFFKTPGIKFDATKFTYLAGNAVTPNGIGISSRLAADSIEDLQKMSGLKFGAHGIDAQAANCALVIKLFGLKDAKIVVGYGGMEEEGLALARGEINAYSNSMHSVNDHIDKNFVKKLVLVTAYERDPMFPDTPTIPEKKKLTPQEKKMFDMVFACKASKPIFAPPGLSKDKADYLSEVFQKLFKMDSYREMMKVRFPIMGPAFHFTGEEWLNLVKETLSIPAKERDDFIELVKGYVT